VRAAAASGSGSAAAPGERVLHEAPPASRGCDGDEPICMAEFRSRMLAAYDSSLGAFAAMRGGEDRGAVAVATEGSGAPGQAEFLGMVERFEPPLTQKQAEYAFRGLDMNGDGHLPSYEFFEVIDAGHFFPNDWMVEAVTREAMDVAPAEAVAAPRGLPGRVGGVWLVLTATLGVGMAVGALFCWAGLRALHQSREPEREGEDEDLGAPAVQDPAWGAPRSARPSVAQRARIVGPDGGDQDGSPSSRLRQMAADDAEADEFRPKNLLALFSCCGGTSRPPPAALPSPPRGGDFA